MGISSSYMVTECQKSTRRGPLLGITVSERDTGAPVYERFARIRYALPPTGEWRWQRPRALPETWMFGDGSKDGEPEDCRSFGSMCPQITVPSVVLDNPERTEVKNSMDEDCLYLNIWIPAGATRPQDGFPVLFDIPGGRHQSGHGMQQDFFDPADRMRETRETPYIIVSANARVGILGFLSLAGDEGLPSSGIDGNFGFFDLRMALEWVHANISLFGGDPSNITAGGLGPATLYQLHYDIRQTAAKQIIRRAIFMGDAPLVQPTIAAQPSRKQQFEALINKLSKDNAAQPDNMVDSLRKKTSASLMEVVQTLNFGFMPVTDDNFVAHDLMETVWDGTLGQMLRAAKVQILIGDTSEERNLYAYFINRSEARFRFSNALDSYDALVTKLTQSVCPDEMIIHAILAQYDTSSNHDWTKLYCDVMADTQTHAPMRGLVKGLFAGGMTVKDVLRYQTSWRPQCLDRWLPAAIGTCHAVEIPVWWYSGFRAGFSDEDKNMARAFLRPINKFIVGDVEAAASSWGSQTQEDVRVFRHDGGTRNVKDMMWQHQSRISQSVRLAHSTSRKQGL